MSFQYSSHKHRRRALHMSDKVRSAIWPHEVVRYYPDIAFPYNLFTAPTVGSRAGRQIQGIRIRLGLESRRHTSNAQCIYSLLNSERLGYCLRLDLTNFTPKMHAYMILFLNGMTSLLYTCDMRFHVVTTIVTCRAHETSVNVRTQAHRHRTDTRTQQC